MKPISAKIARHGLLALLLLLAACLDAGTATEIDCTLTDEGCVDDPNPEPTPDPEPNPDPNPEAEPDPNPEMGPEMEPGMDPNPEANPDPNPDPNPEPLECDPPCFEGEVCENGACRPGDPMMECEDDDVPDVEGIDANCDGVDGNAELSIFVTEFGDDTQEGTRNAPMRSIQAAIQKAARDEVRKTVLVSPGVYDGPINLASGVQVHGGYDFNWMRDLDVKPTIRGGNPAVIAEGITEPTIFDSFAVESDRLAEPESNNTAIHVRDSMGLTLVRLRVTSGDGGDGIPGMSGMGGMSGDVGATGVNGCEDGGLPFVCGDCNQPRGGNGGPSPCGQLGGTGGSGSHPDRNGTDGIAGSGANGGPGGPRGRESRDGENGQPGNDGPEGTDGMSAAPLGMNIDGQWQSFDGTDGTDGQPGGGGGGGGGGGDGDSGGCDSWGGGGGGGGGGGCPGTLGTGGTGGGASFGIYVFDSVITIEDCEIFTGNGGQGGDGGRGGGGGAGGGGGRGGGGEDDSGVGGTGGRGGRGGPGGSGGGGGGGHSVGIYANTPWMTPPVDCAVTPGLSGNGGFGGGMDGADGESAEILPEPEMMDDMMDGGE